MMVEVIQGRIEEMEDKAIVVNLFKRVKRPGGATGAVDKALGGMIRDLIRGGDLKGKFKEAVLFRTFRKIPAERVLVVGLGEKEKFSLDRIREVSAKAARHLRDAGVDSYSTIVHGAGIGGFDLREASEALVEGALLGTYKFDRYKTELKEEEKRELRRMRVLVRDPADVGRVEEAIRWAEPVSVATNFVRDLVASPARDKTPTRLAEIAVEIAREAALKCTIIDREEAEKLNMGAFLGVAQGSDEPPKLIVLEYRGGKKGEKPIAVVGKGITFDSGGLSLKPAKSMEDMKEDMAGAAATIGILKAAAELKLPVNLIGFAPCTENLPSGKATKPGDVLKTHTGKTIEVRNTDAEGRLVLADALGYATGFEPQAIIDMATLTGACMVALGKKTTGMMGTSENLMERLKAAGKRTGDYVWPLPLFEDYEEQIKSDIADVKNTGGRYGGAITAALLLKKFVKDIPWVHLDIAGTVWTDGGAADLKREYLPKGATGIGVRLLLQLLRDWKQSP
ncbi:MAG: leucyl aminopeptidase [Candidatus Thermoplasmatota archaeon]|nr:leucyl aminopeptidase [Candidatus Thermoplasmatota archaeon]